MNTSVKALVACIACIFLLIQSTYARQSPVVYPKVAGYVGILHPIVTYGSDRPHYNFDGVYIVGMPVGLNLWKSAKIGFSMEFVPTVRAEGDQ